MLNTTFSKTFLTTLLVLLLAACGGGTTDEGTDQTATKTTFVGSVGDGPVVNAQVTLRNAAGQVLATTSSDAQADYHFTVDVLPEDYPLTVEATGGTDLVSGSAPELNLRSTIMAPGETRANMTPHSSLIVALAEKLPGGLSTANMQTAQNTVLTRFAFGLDMQQIDDPLHTDIGESNVAQIIKSSEAMGEWLRRTRDAILDAGTNLDIDQLIELLADDLVDGQLDGSNGQPQIADMANIISGAVLLETMINQLQVNGVDATQAMDAAIAAVLPGSLAGTGHVLITGDLIQQTRLALATAGNFDPTATLDDIDSDLAALTAGSDVTTVRNGLPADSTTRLDSAILNGLQAINDGGGTTNQAPVISGSPAGSVAEGSAYSFTPSASDADGDNLTFSILNKPIWASFSTTTGNLSGTPGAGTAGSYGNISISVTDGTDSASLTGFTIVVSSISNNNSAPTITGTPATVVAERATYTFTPSASDADGDALSFSITNKPNWAGFDPTTGQLFGNPGYNDAGLWGDIHISVTDGTESVSLPSFSITVSNTNQAPVISGSPAGSVAEGSAYSFTPSASDPDGDNLVFSITNKPTWASFDTTTGQLSGTPGAGTAGSYGNILISVTDGTDSASLTSFTLTVTSTTNSAPSISGSPAGNATEGTAYSFTPSASDPDGDNLTFSIVNKPIWTSFNTATGQLSGTPGAGTAGSYDNIGISVSDGTESATLNAFQIIVTAPAPGGGNDLYVDPLIGASSCNDYDVGNRACGAGSETAFRNLSGAAAAAAAGETVLIREGDYNEALIPQNSGTPGNYITYRNYESEQATITGTDLSPAIDISNRDYLILQGLRVHDVYRWMYALNAHYNILQYNSFLRASHGSTSAKTGLFFQESTHNKILNNTIEDSTQDNLALIKSDYNLVEGNTFVRASHTLWVIKCGNFNVIRNNYFYNEIQKIGEIYDCDNVGFDHEFIIHDATKYNLVEGNTFAKTNAYYSTSGGNGIQYAGQNGIIRQNVFYANNSGLGMQNYSPEARFNTHNRVYNNVFHKNLCGGITTMDSSVGGFEDNLFANNILNKNTDCERPDAPYQHVYRNDMSGYQFDSNNFFSGNVGDNVIGHWGSSGISLVDAQNTQPAFYVNNLEQDPQFVDEVNRDFTLESTSPMIDAGRFLTTTVGSGSGTTLVVDDAGYFYDGFGIDGEAGDEIQLQGSSETAIIVGINYASHTITLDRTLTWNAGQGVALKYNGAAPDMGAFETP
ncbi:MAG: right-handed parallel beta-helix repeat-containing protein [gamma proteobacterium endosymbiont of Lamellibrachia anaximandri]|nr:right-handed parallel beta-helix repeat-containing protein [gamma proteobacterium endosymbiont of Lamellibrachia anaximandri]